MAADPKWEALKREVEKEIFLNRKSAVEADKMQVCTLNGDSFGSGYFDGFDKGLKAVLKIIGDLEKEGKGF